SSSDLSYARESSAPTIFISVAVVIWPKAIETQIKTNAAIIGIFFIENESQQDKVPAASFSLPAASSQQLAARIDPNEMMCLMDPARGTDARLYQPSAAANLLVAVS